MLFFVIVSSHCKSIKLLKRKLLIRVKENDKNVIERERTIKQHVSGKHMGISVTFKWLKIVGDRETRSQKRILQERRSIKETISIELMRSMYQSLKLSRTIFMKIVI